MRSGCGACGTTRHVHAGTASLAATPEAVRKTRGGPVVRCAQRTCKMATPLRRPAPQSGWPPGQPQRLSFRHQRRAGSSCSRGRCAPNQPGTTVRHPGPIRQGHQGGPHRAPRGPGHRRQRYAGCRTSDTCSAHSCDQRSRHIQIEPRAARLTGRGTPRAMRCAERRMVIWPERLKVISG